jgi:hypothetical protein
VTPEALVVIVGATQRHDRRHHPAADMVLLNVAVYNQNVTIMGDLCPLRHRLRESRLFRYSWWAPGDAVRVICC